jgi:hypothetical protein
VRMRADRDLPFKLSPTRKPVCQFATQNSTVSPSDAIGKLVAGSRRRPQKPKKHVTTGYSSTTDGGHATTHEAAVLDASQTGGRSDPCNAAVCGAHTAHQQWLSSQHMQL